MVQEYLLGEGGYQFLSNKYGIFHFKLVHQWVNRYNEFGAVSLQRNRQRTAYDSNFNLNAVNLYLTSKKSYREVANQLGLNNPALITRWVIKYRQKGEFTFRLNPRGRPRKEGKGTQSKSRKSKKELSELKQQFAEVQKENLYLRGIFKRAEEAAKGTRNAGKSRLGQNTSIMK